MLKQQRRKNTRNKFSRILKINALRELKSATEEELSPSLHFGDASQSALMPSVLDRAFKEEL